MMNPRVLVCCQRSFYQILRSHTQCQCRAISQQHREWDEVGPPDPISNIRPIRLKKSRSAQEQELQGLQQKVWELNHHFWQKHNIEFQEQKENFIAEVLKEKGESTDAMKLTANELSLFYKQFLDSKFKEHMQYNRKWMKLHTVLTWTILKVKLSNFVKGYSSS